MNEDLLLVVFFLTVLLLVWYFCYRYLNITRTGKIIFTVNAILAFLYESYYYYSLLYKSAGGVGLVWMFLLVIVPAIHSALLFIFSLVYFYSKSGNNKQRNK